MIHFMGNKKKRQQNFHCEVLSYQVQSQDYMYNTVRYIRGLINHGRNKFVSFTYSHLKQQL